VHLIGGNKGPVSGEVSEESAWNVALFHDEVISAALLEEISGLEARRAAADDEIVNLS
jgi:hypothetical protein